MGDILRFAQNERVPQRLCNRPAALCVIFVSECRAAIYSMLVGRGAIRKPIIAAARWATAPNPARYLDPLRRHHESVKRTRLAGNTNRGCHKPPWRSLTSAPTTRMMNAESGAPPRAILRDGSTRSRWLETALFTAMHTRSRRTHETLGAPGWLTWKRCPKTPDFVDSPTFPDCWEAGMLEAFQH